jgi:hypothetical protein
VGAFWFRVARNGGPREPKWARKSVISMAKSIQKPMPENILKNDAQMMDKWFQNRRKHNEKIDLFVKG